MTCCTERLGDALDLMRDCRWSPALDFGFGLFIRGPNPSEGYIGTWRVCVESHAPPATIDNTPWIPIALQRLLVVHLLDEVDAPDPSCPTSPRFTPHTWQIIQALHDDVAPPTPPS